MREYTVIVAIIVLCVIGTYALLCALDILFYAAVALAIVCGEVLYRMQR